MTRGAAIPAGSAAERGPGLEEAALSLLWCPYGTTSLTFPGKGWEARELWGPEGGGPGWRVVSGKTASVPSPRHLQARSGATVWPAASPVWGKSSLVPSSPGLGFGEASGLAAAAGAPPDRQGPARQRSIAISFHDVTHGKVPWFSSALEAWLRPWAWDDSVLSVPPVARSVQAPGGSKSQSPWP